MSRSRLRAAFCLLLTLAIGSSVPLANGAAPNPTNGVVRIVNRQSEEICLGSGTFVQTDGADVGLVLTCAHLFSDGVGDLLIVSPSTRAVRAVLVAIDEKNDLACLAVDRVRGSAVAIARDLPDEGTPLASCGFGSNGDFRVNRGVQLGYATLEGGQSAGVLELSGDARQGDSGGPIFNARSELVGVIMGTDGQTVDGTHCGRVREFLAENPVTTAIVAEAKSLARKPVADLAHFLRTAPEQSARVISSSQRFALHGRVSFDRSPVRDAQVRLSGMKSGTIDVDEQGRFRFADLPAGSYRIEVAAVIKNRIRQATEMVYVSAGTAKDELMIHVE